MVSGLPFWTRSSREKTNDSSAPADALELLSFSSTWFYGFVWYTYRTIPGFSCRGVEDQGNITIILHYTLLGWRR